MYVALLSMDIPTVIHLHYFSLKKDCENVKM